MAAKNSKTFIMAAPLLCGDPFIRQIAGTDVTAGSGTAPHRNHLSIECARLEKPGDRLDDGGAAVRSDIGQFFPRKRELSGARPRITL
jgi:hypothetical protein